MPRHDSSEREVDFALPEGFSRLTFQTKLLAWYRANDRILPWRSAWRATRDPYPVWVSEIMLQQTVIKAAVPVFERFLKKFPTVAALAAAPEEDVRRAVAGLGYYRRFRMLHDAAKQLVEENENEKSIAWPRDVKGWLALPGIGIYTASALSSITASFPAAVVDGNVERVFCRLLDLQVAPDSRFLKKPFQRLAHDLLDEASPGDFNQAMMELGQLVCTKSQPSCAQCPVRSFCLSHERSTQHLAPTAKVRRQPVVVPLELLIVQKEGRIGLLRRPDGARFLKGTQGFPTLSESKEGDGWQAPTVKGEQVGSFTHTITHHKLRVSVRLISDESNFHGLIWHAPGDIAARLMTSLDQKAWKCFHNHFRQ